jgi:hypothetical protein
MALREGRREIKSKQKFDVNINMDDPRPGRIRKYINNRLRVQLWGCCREGETLEMIG